MKVESKRGYCMRLWRLRISSALPAKLWSTPAYYSLIFAGSVQITWLLLLWNSTTVYASVSIIYSLIKCTHLLLHCAPLDAGVLVSGAGGEPELHPGQYQEVGGEEAEQQQQHFRGPGEETSPANFRRHWVHHREFTLQIDWRPGGSQSYN